MAFIALDWGTSRFRALLCTERGDLIETLESGEGIANLPLKNFEEILLSRCSHWFKKQDISRVIASGMITSKNGWVETPYVTAPAGLAKLKQGAVNFRLRNGIELILLTGVVDNSALPFPDVMRGEETQIMGLGLQNGIVITPGTHSKWVHIVNSEIENFKTYATGELYHTLITHSFIAGFAKPAEFNEVAFMVGVDAVLDNPQAQASSLIFSVRTGFLASSLDENTSADYLSGLLIAKEFQEALDAFKTKEAWLIASQELALRYQMVASKFGVKLLTSDGNLALKGMMRIMA